MDDEQWKPKKYTVIHKPFESSQMIEEWLNSMWDYGLELVAVAGENFIFNSRNPAEEWLNLKP